MHLYQHERLVQIHEEMRSLLEEATSLIRQEGGMPWERAKGYWVTHLSMALDNEHNYLGSSMCTFQDTINELDPCEDEESESEEE